MKPRHYNPFLHALRSSSLLGLCSLVVFSVAHAADVITTGGTTVLNVDNPQNRYLGNGILQISADGDLVISLGSVFNTPLTEFAMSSGGLITIDSEVRLLNGGFARAVWTNNLADMTINGTGQLDIWDGNPVRVDALNGTGSISLGIGLTTPFSPPSGLATGSFNGLHTESKFLAATVDEKFHRRLGDLICGHMLDPGNARPAPFLAIG